MLFRSFFLRVTFGVFPLEHLLVRVVLGPRVISGWSCSTIKPIKRLFFRDLLPTLGIQPVIVSAPYDSPISDFTLSFWLFYLTDEKNYHVALDTLAILPAMGAPRWCWSSREHGAMYGEQLFNDGVLEKLAQKL